MGADDMLTDAGTPPAQPAPPAADAAPKKKADARPSTRARKRAAADPSAKAAAAEKAAAAKKQAQGGRPPADVAKRKALERQLVEAFGMVGMGLVAMGTSPAMQQDGFAVIERAESLATALGALAEQNPSVMRVLSASVNGGAWFGVIAAFSGLAVAIAQNHGVMPTPEVDPALAAMFAAAEPPPDAPAA